MKPVLVTEEAELLRRQRGEKATAPQRQIVARARRVHAELAEIGHTAQRGTAALGHDCPCACGPTPGTRRSRSYGAVMTSSGKCSGWASGPHGLGVLVEREIAGCLEHELLKTKPYPRIKCSAW